MRIKIFAVALITNIFGNHCGKVYFGISVTNNSIDSVADNTIVYFDLFDLPSGLRGCHIHEFGDMTNGCESMGPHFNPLNGIHGNINQGGNHVGDLGNILVDKMGKCNIQLTINYLPIISSVALSIIGRGIVIHANVDDLGKAPYNSSKYTESIVNGNSGSRIACGIIVLCKPFIIDN